LAEQSPGKAARLSKLPADPVPGER